MFMKIPHAILIRAGEPLEGIKEMLKRTGKEKLDNTLTRGPGNLSKALGIYTIHSGMSCSAIKCLLLMMGFGTRKKRSLLHRASVLTMRAKMPYCIIGFM